MGVPLLPQHLDDAELVVEMAFGSEPFEEDPSEWEWTDVTEDVRLGDPISISHGRDDEAAESSPAECTLTLDNTGGDYSYGPRSTHHPHVRRNVPLRVRAARIMEGLRLPGAESSYASTPNDDIDLSDGLDVKIQLTPRSWRPDEFYILAAQSDFSDHKSWALRLLDAGSLELAWVDSDDEEMKEKSDSHVPKDARAIRVTLDPDDDDEYVVEFFYSDSIDGSWHSLGSKSGEDTTSIKSSDSDITIGLGDSGESEFVQDYPLEGTVDAFQLKDSPSGDMVVDIDFTDQDYGDREFKDEKDREWSLHGDAAISRGELFFGYVSSFSPAWSLSTADATVEIEAHGILRRLKQRDKAAYSSMRRDFSQRDSVVAYFPLEDGENSDKFRTGLSDSSTYLESTDGDDYDAAEYDKFPGSEPCLAVEKAQIQGIVDSYEGEDKQRFMCLMHVDEDGIDASSTRYAISAAFDSETLSSVSTVVNEDGAMYINFFDKDGEGVERTSAIDFNLNGERIILSVLLEKTGDDTDYKFQTINVDDRTLKEKSGTIEDHTFARISALAVGSASGDLNDTAFGHYVVINGEDESEIWDIAESSLIAWKGEKATDRIERICREYNIPVTIYGDSDVEMGEQPLGTVLEILRECETADQGVLYDGVDHGLTYISREQRESVPAAVEIDAGEGELAESFEPVDDDQRNVNEATAKQTGGSSVTVSDKDGSLGVRAIGRYDEDIEVNVRNSAMLSDYAEWMVHLGTVEGYRYPEVSMDVRAVPGKAAEIMGLEPSARVQVRHVDDVFPQVYGDTVDLLVEGVETEISPYEWTTTLKCSPYAPWRVIRVEGDDDDDDDAGDYVCHLDTDGSELGESAGKGDTSIKVKTLKGETWTTDSSDLPLDLDVRGVKVHVTDIDEADSSDVQEFTVDSVDMDLEEGWAVNVWDPPALGLGGWND